MITARPPALPVHALLDNDPAPLVADDETVQIEIESILDGSAVDLRNEPARLRKRCAVEAYPFSYRAELVRSLPRMPAAPAADASPRLRAPMTLVVMPEECQSIPITAPNAWNQKGWARRRRSSSRP